MGSSSVLSLTSLKLPLSSDSAPASQFVDECPGPRQRADSAQQGFWRAPRRGRPGKWPRGSEVGVMASSLQLQLRAHFSLLPPLPHILLVPSTVSSSMRQTGDLNIPWEPSYYYPTPSCPVPIALPTSGFKCVCECIQGCTLLTADADQASRLGSLAPSLLQREPQRELSSLLSSKRPKELISFI